MRNSDDYQAIDSSSIGQVDDNTSSMHVAVERSEQIMLAISGRIFRQSLEVVLRKPNRTIVGDCQTLEEVGAALRARPELRPNLVLVGLSTPDSARADFGAIRALRADYPSTRWVVLSRTGSAEFCRLAVEAQIDGLLHEDSPAEVLRLLVDLVLLGYSFVPTELATVLAEVLVPPATPASAGLGRDTAPAIPMAGHGAHRWHSSLSEREREILRGLVEGLSNKLIARNLNISEATVKVHVKALLRKMQVANRTQAAISALHWLHDTPHASIARRPEVSLQQAAE